MNLEIGIGVGKIMLTKSHSRYDVNFPPESTFPCSLLIQLVPLLFTQLIWRVLLGILSLNKRLFLASRHIYIGGSRNFWKGGLQPFMITFVHHSVRKGGVAALKMAKNDLFLVKFSDQRGGCNPRNPPPRSANDLPIFSHLRRYKWILFLIFCSPCTNGGCYD